MSIPSNVAEGAARKTSKGVYSVFVHFAQGSLSELDTQLEIAKRLGFLSERRRLRQRLENAMNGPYG